MLAGAIPPVSHHAVRAEDMCEGERMKRRKQWLSALRRLGCDVRGQDMIEYALMAAFVAVVSKRERARGVATRNRPLG